MIYENARYLVCGEKNLVAEYGNDSSLGVSYKVLAMREVINRKKMPGVLESCPGSNSLMVNYDPFTIRFDRLVERLRKCEEECRFGKIKIPSRIVKIPVWYNDKWTRQCAEYFNVRNNIEWTAEINGMSIDEFIRAHSTYVWQVTSLGFSPGQPAFLAVNPEKVLVAPKYEPRTWSPRGAVYMGGNSGGIYAANGPGGCSLLGMTPLLLFDMARRNSVFKHDLMLFRPGDRIEFRPIEEEEFIDISNSVHQYSYETNEGDVIEISFGLEEENA